MKVKQLREAIRNIIKSELKENQPAKEPMTIPVKPGTKEKPDEKRRKIGKPGVSPKPKASLKEEEMIDKITQRFLSKKKTNENQIKDKLSPENKKKYKELFGTKDTNPEFKKGYEKGYGDGYLDAKGNVAYNDKYSWDKYSSKNK